MYKYVAHDLHFFFFYFLDHFYIFIKSEWFVYFLFSFTFEKQFFK